jgi:hypothetical protein
MSLLGYSTKEIMKMSEGIDELHDALLDKYGKEAVKVLEQVGDLLEGLLSEGWTV